MVTGRGRGGEGQDMTQHSNSLPVPSYLRVHAHNVLSNFVFFAKLLSGGRALETLQEEHSRVTLIALYLNKVDS